MVSTGWARNSNRCRSRSNEAGCSCARSGDCLSGFRSSCRLCGLAQCLVQPRLQGCQARLLLGNQLVFGIEIRGAGGANLGQLLTVLRDLGLQLCLVVSNQNTCVPSSTDVDNTTQ
jgi:hypothetical protein